MGFNRVSIPNVSNHEVENQIIEKSGFSVNRVEVNRTAKGIMSPVERGHYVFDNKVIMPIEVTAEILVKEDEWDYVWSELELMFNNRKYEFYTIYTKGEIVKDLMLLELPRKEEPDKFDAVELTLKFVQVKIANEGRVYASISNPAKKSDATTQPTGQKVLTAIEKLMSRAKSIATLGFL